MKKRRKIKETKIKVKEKEIPFKSAAKIVQIKDANTISLK